MPKALCLISLVVAALLFILFAADFGLSMAGMIDVAPFQGASMLMDIAFLVLSVVLAVLSWMTFREQP
ncbi:MAG: hypothetical protein R3C05_25435 [Pirellulaceae bacterium]